MRLENSTNIPSSTIRDLIRAVRPAGVYRFDVRVRNTNAGFAGRAYVNGLHSPRYWGGRTLYRDRLFTRPFIVVRVARTDQKARRVASAGRGGYLPMEIGSRLEALVVLLGHELRHLWQAQHTRGQVYGARGRFSERDADAYALQMLRRYRRGELAESL
jgi:hypothetical protein